MHIQLYEFIFVYTNYEFSEFNYALALCVWPSVYQRVYTQTGQGTHKVTHIHTRPNAHTRPDTHTMPNARPHTRPNAHKPTHIHTHTHKANRTHTQALGHIYIYIYIYIYTYIYSCCICLWCLRIYAYSLIVL